MNKTDDLKCCFAPEAWELFQSFLNSLERVMKRNGVDPKEQEAVIDGLLDFVDDFCEEKGSIEYSTALLLLKEIGSPSDVLLAMNLHIKVSEQAIDSDLQHHVEACRKCGWNNLRDARFCERCGASITKRVDVKGKINQWVIDHPYRAVFAFIYLLLPFIETMGMLIYNLYHTGFIGDLELYPVLFIVLFINPINIMIAFILALFIGYVLDFFFRDVKSEKIQLMNLINSLENSFAIGIILASLGGTCLTIVTVISLVTVMNYDLLGQVLFPTTAFAIIGILVIALLMIFWNHSERPIDPEYIQLLRLKKTIKSRMRHYETKSTAIVILVFITMILVYPVVIAFLASEKITIMHWIMGLVEGLTLSACIAGGYNIYYYSWSRMKKEFSDEDLR
ncbi:MAG: hypothetical protein ACFFD4_35755 [Candidatus Odinarchaeota archaeon]